MPKPRQVSIYKSARRAEMYLYVDKDAELEAVPEPLLVHFATPIHVLDLMLHEDRLLARAKAVDVLSAIEEKGFYLQMPPGEVKNP